MNARPAAAFAAFVILVGCGGAKVAIATSHKGYFGTIRTDGRSLGQRAWTMSGESSNYGYQDGWCRFSDDGKSVKLRTSSYASAGWVTVPLQTSDGDVDVSLPWSHVVFPRNRCSRFDVEQDVFVPGSGRVGTKVHLSCQVSEPNDVLEVDATFVDCTCRDPSNYATCYGT